MSCVFVHTYVLGVNGILSVDETEITENSAKLISELPCFSSNLQCVLSNFTMNSMDVNVTNNVSNITGSLMAYSYPTHTINITGLDSGTTYSYCIVATNMTNMMEVGESMCGNFTTIQKSKYITFHKYSNSIFPYIYMYLIWIRNMPTNRSTTFVMVEILTYVILLEKGMVVPCVWQWF